jgi:glycosyltransferase involved in cell wall biosynthesis
LARLVYVMDPHLSHQRAASPYVQILQTRHHVSDGTLDQIEAEALEDAQAVIVHAELRASSWKQLLVDLEKRNKVLIAYSVWEADVLPAPYLELLAHFDEIWTPSRFCRQVYAKAFPNVARLPHVVDGLPVSMKRAGDTLDLLVFMKERDRRKNLLQTLRALDAVFARWPEAWPRFHLHLVGQSPPGLWHDAVRQPLLEFTRRWNGHVQHWTHPTDSELDVLYQRCHVLVSLHHGEAWGLTLSEALSHGLLVVASGWSGCLEFLSTANAFLVGGRVETIRADDRSALFQPPMRWFYPDLEHAIHQIQEACRAWVEDRQTPYVAAARRALAPFAAGRVARLLRQRLRGLGLEP